MAFFAEAFVGPSSKFLQLIGPLCRNACVALGMVGGLGGCGLGWPWMPNGGFKNCHRNLKAGEKGANYLDQLKGMTMLMAFHRHNYYKIWLLDLSLGRWPSTRQMEIIASNQNGNGHGGWGCHDFLYEPIRFNPRSGPFRLINFHGNPDPKNIQKSPPPTCGFLI